jgi:predicted GNAT family acetyltransferase
VAADHALNRYWGKGVPVIEAANASISAGQRYWQNPEVVPAHNGHRFAVNLYYHKFQYYNEEVHASRVRSYAIFSPAEFFAEVYTVFYEEAGRVPDSDLGRLVPVSSWRDWIKTHVHDRNHSPTASPAAGTTPGVGAKAGNPGM